MHGSAVERPALARAAHNATARGNKIARTELKFDAGGRVCSRSTICAKIAGRVGRNGGMLGGKVRFRARNDGVRTGTQGNGRHQAAEAANDIRLLLYQVKKPVNKCGKSKCVYEAFLVTEMGWEYREGCGRWRTRATPRQQNTTNLVDHGGPLADLPYRCLQ